MPVLQTNTVFLFNCPRPCSQFSKIHLHTTYNLVPPWNRIVLKERIVVQLVNKIPAFYWIRELFTALTVACHKSLAWAAWIRSTFPNSVFKIHINVILTSTSNSPKLVFFPAGLLLKCCMYLSYLPRVLRSHLSHTLFGHFPVISDEDQFWSYLIFQFSPALPVSKIQIICSVLSFQTPSCIRNTLIIISVVPLGT
jgi:hypothetical protein